MLEIFDPHTLETLRELKILVQTWNSSSGTILRISSCTLRGLTLFPPGPNVTFRTCYVWRIYWKEIGWFKFCSAFWLGIRDTILSSIDKQMLVHTHYRYRFEYRISTSPGRVLKGTNELFVPLI